LVEFWHSLELSCAHIVFYVFEVKECLLPQAEGWKVNQEGNQHEAGIKGLCPRTLLSLPSRLASSFFIHPYEIFPFLVLLLRVSP
jgi:hypothetical protein